MKKVTLDGVLSVINSNIKDTEITSEQLTEDLTNLGMDSIIFIQIVISLEEEFECEIPDSKLLIAEMNTIEKIINVLKSLYAEKTV